MTKINAKRLTNTIDYVVDIIQYNDNSFSVIINKRKVIAEKRIGSCEGLDEGGSRK